MKSYYLITLKSVVIDYVYIFSTIIYLILATIIRYNL